MSNISAEQPRQLSPYTYTTQIPLIYGLLYTLELCNSLSTGKKTSFEARARQTRRRAIDTSPPYISPPSAAMHFPTLTPLQSRFAACLGTSILLLIIYYSLSPAHFAYAAELDSIHNQDHNHHRIPQGHGLDLANDIDWGDDEVDLDSASFDGTAQYQAGFLGMSRDIIGRALEDTFALKNNVPNELNVSPGDVKYYVFENSSVWGSATAWRTGLPTNISRGDQEVIWKRNERASEEHGDERAMENRGDEYEIGMEDGKVIKRQTGASKMVYISANTCLQPGSNDTNAVVPQLTLYVSTTDQNPKPGPGQPDTLQTAFPLVEGYVEAKVNATGNVFASVAAPNITSKFSGGWNYQIAASIDASYYYYNDTSSFIWTIDTDSNSALIATYNLTSENNSDETLALREKWMKTPAPFSMFVYNQSTPLVNGLRNSFCGLDKLNFEEIKIEVNMTARGMGSNPKQQFYISGLVPGQKYTGVLGYNGVNRSADQGPGVVGGGGQLWKAMNFTTKTGTSLRPSTFSPS
jgi:calcium channel MID1